jgi:hypothetical protein
MRSRQSAYPDFRATSYCLMAEWFSPSESPRSLTYPQVQPERAGAAPPVRSISLPLRIGYSCPSTPRGTRLHPRTRSRDRAPAPYARSARPACSAERVPARAWAARAGMLSHTLPWLIWFKLQPGGRSR